MNRFASTVASIVAAVALVAVVAHITQPGGFIPLADAEQSMPPTYLSGVVTYAPDGRFAKLLMGATRFLSCRDALDDTESAIAKAQERQPPGARTEGVCFPLHTYNYDDVTSVKAGPKSPET